MCFLQLFLDLVLHIFCRQSYICVIDGIDGKNLPRNIIWSIIISTMGTTAPGGSGGYG